MDVGVLDTHVKMLVLSCPGSNGNKGVAGNVLYPQKMFILRQIVTTTEIHNLVVISINHILSPVNLIL